MANKRNTPSSEPSSAVEGEIRTLWCLGLKRASSGRGRENWSEGPELSSESHGELETIRWVTTHPPNEDFTWEQRSAREFKEASPAGFYQRKAKLEELEAAKPAASKPIWHGPGPCPECKRVNKPTNWVKRKPRPDDAYEPAYPGGVENTLRVPQAVDVPEKAKEMIARVLRRIPRHHFLDFMLYACFVMPETGGSRWFSLNLRRHIIVIDRQLIDRTEEEQVAEILPLVARASSTPGIPRLRHYRTPLIGIAGPAA